MKARALAVVLLTLAACGGEDPPNFAGLYSISEDGLTVDCPTANLNVSFGISDGVQGGPDHMTLCRWNCRQGEQVLLRFLRSEEQQTPWEFDKGFTGPCIE